MATRRSNKTVSFGDAMKVYVARLDRSGKLQQAEVLDVWTSIVGANIATHTRVEGLREGELLVSVDSPVWANELSAMSENLRVRLNKRVGQERVRHIRFTVSQSVEKERDEEENEEATGRRYGGSRIKPLALSVDERRAVEKSVEEIEDETLREAAFRATIRDLEWKKGLEASNVAQNESGGLSGSKTGRKPKQL